LLSKATLALVGKIADPAFFRELYFLAESLGDFEVCLRPPVDAENSGLDAIDETDVIIVPSRNESFGLVALEAMMLSKVCVVSASAGVSEIIRDGHDGLVFPACDPVALSGLLGGIISGGFDLGLIGRNARETYLDGFTLERFERAMLRACGLPEAPG